MNRHFTRVGFKISSFVESGDARFEGNVENISLQGIFIAGPQLEPGSAAEITITLDGVDPQVAIKVAAEAVRTTETGTAFRFIRVDIDSFIHLRNIVSYASSNGDAIMGEFGEYIDQKIQEQGEVS